VAEILIEACRRNNTELLTETLEGKSEEEAAKLLNETTTVMGNHLYHEAASRGNCRVFSFFATPFPLSRERDKQRLNPFPFLDEIIDLLLDQANFECDPVNRLERDTPLHTVIRWINSEPAEQRAFGNSLVEMMLEAGSNPRLRNGAKLTPYQLVDPRNAELRDLLQKHEYAMLNAGDFVDAGESAQSSSRKAQDESDDDAEFSGSDEEERAEWERRRKEKRRGKR